MNITSESMLLTETEFFDIRLEYNEDFVIIHLPRVDKVSKEVFLEAEAYLRRLNKFFQTAGYETMYIALGEDDSKMQRLVKKLHFSYIGTKESLNIYEYLGEK